MSLKDGRVLCWFSCGAASAAATWRALKKYKGRDVRILYCDTLKYEHPDNQRFLRECEDWYEQEIEIIGSHKYEDIFDVFRKTGWLVGPGGARCTHELKRQVRLDYSEPNDIHVFGYTADEEQRIYKFIENNPTIYTDWLLLQEGWGKPECKALLRQLGIDLPVMYWLGYKNNNCIGCVKGGQGYWNKVRVDFPEAFERMAKLEREMNVTVCKTYAGGKGRQRVFLDELNPLAGRYEAEPDISCGPQCEVGDDDSTS
jgi:hypothetical protein